MKAARSWMQSTLAVWLLLAATLFLRALLPVGTMPDRDASGAISVRLCGSAGWLVQAVQQETHSGRHHASGHHAKSGEPEHDEGEQHASQACAFAGLGTPAATPPDMPALLLPTPVATLFAATSARPASVTVPRPLPPARAPPLPA
jgi:hypothetical protein